MKFIQQTIHYASRNSEECGLFIEKIVCDVLGIRFNSRRAYINDKNYPTKLKDDIENAAKPLLESLNISHHLGNQNKYYDFTTTSLQTVSIKSNINGYKVCPQMIGQVSLKNLNLKTGNDFKSITAFKNEVFQNTLKIVNMYLSYLFCCDHMISFQLEQGIIHYLQKLGKVSIKDIPFKFSKDTNTWNESNTLSIMLDNKYISLCEFQIHSNRNCIKCRFNMNTIISLIEGKNIENVELKSVSLNNHYKIKVQSKMFD